MDELKSQIESLQKEVNTYKTNYETLSSKLVEINNSQLHEPLDIITGNIIDNRILTPVSITMEAAVPATSTNYSHFFTADRSYTIYSFIETHGTAGSDGGAVTLQLRKMISGVALASGIDLLSTALSLKTTANTPQYGTLVKTQDIQLKAGDRLGIVSSGTLTAVANLTATVYLKYT